MPRGIFGFFRYCARKAKNVGAAAGFRPEKWNIYRYTRLRAENRIEETKMEILTNKPCGSRVRAVLFDFDGTISTLRCGWEETMRPLMLECISGKTSDWDEALVREVDAYIDDSTGIQTIHQMKWLNEQVQARRPGCGLPDDPWWYKGEYNRRLMETVRNRIADVESGRRPASDFLMAGSVEFLKALRGAGVKLYVASGTDHPDVLHEAAVLGVDALFDRISGAPVDAESCSKEQVLKDLIETEGLSGGDVAVIGDGKVEIALGNAAGARTIGLATDEARRQGVNPVKRERLVKAGADCIEGDFLDIEALLNFLGLRRRSMQLDTSGVTTCSAESRHNLVRIDTLAVPGETPVPEWNPEGFATLVERVRKAKESGREIIFSMGAHVIKCGLSRYVIELMKAGYITHIAGNGACSIHDFELACLGGTSEHVPTAIEDGSFGMWEETGRWMTEAIQAGARDGIGYGERLGRYMDEHPERFPNRNVSIWYNAYKLDIPATNHIALGTDIIHQHPICDFEAIGKASGIDFKKMCWSVAHLDKGVYMNFGSGVIGPEVFLKALSVARNLQYPTFDITTANFDLIDLGDFRKPIGYEDPNYYYRPRKNIVNRPVSRGGWGWHFVGDHQETIPNLWKALLAKGE